MENDQQIAMLQLQLEQQQKIAEKQSELLEESQLEIERTTWAFEKERQKSALAEQQYTELLENTFGELALVQELTRLRAENEQLKQKNEYLLEHSADQQIELKATVAKLKGRLQVTQEENEQLEKTKRALDTNLIVYKKKLADLEQSFISETKALQFKLVQVTKQAEQLAEQNEQLLVQLHSEYQLVDIMERILKEYTEPRLAEGYVQLEGFLSL